MKTTIRKVIGEVRRAFGGGEGGAFLGRNRFPQYWERVPEVARAQRERECGGEAERYANLFDYAIRRWGSRLSARPLNVLVVGCSHFRDLPELLLAVERVGSILVADSDCVALENLREARNPKIECWQMDLNSDPLPRGAFDLVVCWDSLNHLRGLEHILSEVTRVLERSGLFIAREYVGPNRLQFGGEQMGLVNALLPLLPENLRRTPDMDEVVEQQFAPELSEMLRLDPDKAVRSEDICGVISGKLRVLEGIALGGTLLSPLLANITAGFTGDKPEEGRILRTLLDVEMRLISGGLITSDYMAFIARLP